MSDANPYQKQIENVRWSVEGEELVIRVGLYGEGRETKSGNSMIGRSPGWQQIDTRLWSEFAFNLSVIHRLPGWEERNEERKRVSELTAQERREARRLKVAQRYAEESGMSLEAWTERRDRRSLERSWKEAAKEYQRMYGKRLPGYTGRVRLARRRNGGKRKHTTSAEQEGRR